MPITSSLDEILSEARARSRSIVLTNGCFDMLHAGHVEVIRAAAAEGDVLVVGVNDDAGVQFLKGAGRPMFPLADRLELLRAIRWVDAVAVLDELTADTLIRRVQPDVYVKGADYDPAAGGRELPEAATLHELGVRVAYVPLVGGRSTSGLIERLRRTQ